MITVTRVPRVMLGHVTCRHVSVAVARVITVTRVLCNVATRDTQTCKPWHAPAEHGGQEVSEDPGAGAVGHLCQHSVSTRISHLSCTRCCSCVCVLIQMFRSGTEDVFTFRRFKTTTSVTKGHFKKDHHG